MPALGRTTTIQVREGGRLWSLLSVITETHMDDLNEDRLKVLEVMIRSWRVTRADRSKLKENKL